MRFGVIKIVFEKQFKTIDNVVEVDGIDSWSSLMRLALLELIAFNSI